MKHLCGVPACPGHDGQNEACNGPEFPDRERQEKMDCMRKHVSARTDAAYRRLLDEEREKALRALTVSAKP
jgi:hypothetical protein